MKKNNIIKLLIAGIFLIITIVFIILDNETIFPSSLVAFFLVLTLLKGNNIKSSSKEKALQWTIITFSLITILLNVIIPIILPIIISGLDISNFNLELTTNTVTKDIHALKEHFVQVTINDMHELCYSTSVLLIINLIFLFVFRKKR